LKGPFTVFVVRLVAIGDSTVEGLEDLQPDGTYRGWADHLARHLAARHEGLTYANLAVRGRLSGQVREEQLPLALAMQPDVAVVVAGVNDLLRPRLDPAVLRDNLHHMHRALIDAGAQVITFTMPDMSRVAPLAVALRPRLKLLNDITQESAALYGTTVVDLAAHEIASHPALWHDDRLHGNAEGHRRIGLALAEALGCEVDDWRAPLPDHPRKPLPRVVLDEAAWVRSHLLPWAWRHLRGQSSGDERACKRPELTPLEA
jgi:lysophospholipase L1-like esterase